LGGAELRALAFDAVAPPAEDRTESVAALDDRQRAELAEQLGYRTIGAELPEDVSLGDVIQSMPKSVSSLESIPSLYLIFYFHQRQAASCGVVCSLPGSVVD
jgi:hypothetical protein